jgi:hypothetical protein
VSDDGYFRVEYGTENPLGIDLRADGSEAFLLSFSGVFMPSLWRGLYNFQVNGIRYDLLRELAGIKESGTIRIPFSRFSTGPTFVANQISLDAGRVEAPYRLVLDSIVTIPPQLSILTQVGGQIQLLWSTNATGFLLETTPTIGVIPWQTLTNTPVIVGDHFSVMVGTSAASGYFRLRRE